MAQENLAGKELGLVFLSNGTASSLVVGKKYMFGYVIRGSTGPTGPTGPTGIGTPSITIQYKYKTTGFSTSTTTIKSTSAPFCRC